MSAIVALTPFFLLHSVAHAEGSRSLYPNGVAGARAFMDLLDASTRYAGVTARRQFLYVYAKSGEYILLGSSNRNTNANADILVYDPQSFGAKGNETIPANANFSCRSTTPPAASFSGEGRGYIAARVNELAGPDSADGSQSVAGGYLPCAYRAPVDGVYGVLFTAAQSGGAAPGDAVSPPGNFPLGNSAVAAWEVAVRPSASSLITIDARVFTYAWVGYAGGTNSAIHHTLYYATRDGVRYRQVQRGFAPLGYALWANRYGFLDNGQPLYRDLRGTNAVVDNWVGAPELQAQSPQEPLFFSDIDPAGANADSVDAVLQTLGIPLAPLTPLIQSVRFTGLRGDGETYLGGGGTFTFLASNNTTFQIVVSADGANFDPALPSNATLTGVAPDGPNSVSWNGRANDGSVLPVGTFTYRIVGRNGEIHFPIVDAEGSGSGGPSVIKLNGLQSGDATVYFDDRGYATRDGLAVGTSNAALCGANPASGAQTPPSPSHSLLGVDSNTAVGGKFYRYWPSTGNGNTDCGANSGFGDAKALDLWTYQQTPAQDSTLIVVPNPTSTELATQVDVPASAYPGAVVYGSLYFQNVGQISATGVTYGTLAGLQSVTIGTPGNCPTGLVFDLLPGNVTFVSHDAATCVATFSGMPTILDGMTLGGAGQRLLFNFHYFAPASGQVPVSTDTNAVNSSNHPTAVGLTVVNGALADLAVLKTGPVHVDPGQAIAYWVVITNNGPDAADGATYSDPVPSPAIGNVAASCGNATGGAVCAAPTVAGNDVSGVIPTLPAGASVMITITGTVAANSSGTVVNTATVAPPSGRVDTNAGNNSSSTGTSTPVSLLRFEVD